MCHQAKALKQGLQACSGFYRSVVKISGICWFPVSIRATACPQMQSLCISSAEAAPRDDTNVRVGKGKRSKSFLHFLSHGDSHERWPRKPFVRLLAINQNLQTMYVSFGESREEQIILVSISSTEHGKGQEIKECPSRLLHCLSHETLQLNILSQSLWLFQSFLFSYEGTPHRL